MLDRQVESTSKSLGRPALYALILLGVYLTFLVMRPFVVALTWAVIIAILFRRLQVVLEPRVGPNAAALITTLVVVVVIVAPGVALISSLAHEAPHVADYLQQSSQTLPARVQQIWDAARARSPVAMPENPTDVIMGAISRTFAFLAPHAGSFVVDLLGMLGSFVAMLFALFFMLRDGEAIRRQLRDRLPFSKEENESLIADTRDLVIASVGAGLVVAAAQGLIGGLAFRIVGIGAPVFWGVVMGFCSLLPVVGATIVWVPAAIGLLLSDHIGPGVLLLLLGVFGISMADNVLRPLLLSGRTSISGFVVFFGLLGGAAAFGPVGLVLGPIVLVTTARLLENLRHPDRLDPSPLPDDRIIAGSK